MIRRPASRWVQALYDIGLATPELATVPGQPFIDLAEFGRLYERDIMLAAYEGGVPVGFVTAMVWRRYGCVSFLAVRPEARNHGHGRALLEAAVRALEARGATHLYGWARMGSAVNSLAAKAGFRQGAAFRYVYR